MATEAFLLELNLTRLLRERARNAAPGAKATTKTDETHIEIVDGAGNVQVITTASLDAVSLAGVAALAHVDEAWAATVKQCTISAALRVELRHANTEMSRLQRMCLG